MRDPVQHLQNEVRQIQSMLVEERFFSFSSEKRESLLATSQELLNKLDAFANSSLTVGILGGTGVGKSTLMNALASSEISSTSHRRPHTYKVLIYRHSGTPLPPDLQISSVPWHEITHDAESIKQIVLCDLPDFDSLAGENREHVIHFLEYLDLLVWVTSPEKYADAKFYAFLQWVPKAKENFHFVLNKMDVLFQTETLEEGYEQLAKVMDRFQQYISQNEINNAPIYVLSAKEARESPSVAPWNQFPTFRHQIFQQRDAKEITAIKGANLDVEVQRLFSVFQEEALKLRTTAQILGDFIARAKKERSKWLQGGQEALEIWLGRDIKDRVVSHLNNPSHLIGPGYGIASIVQEWKKRTGEVGNETVRRDSYLLLPKEIATTLQQHLERMENQMTNELLRRDLPSHFIDRLNAVLAVGEKWENLVERLQHFLQMRLMTLKTPSFIAFRFLQRLIYFLVFICFIVALAGDTAWQNLWEHPGWFSFIELVFTAIRRLFSPLGLAALGSYALVNLFFGFRFYNRCKKLLQQHSRKFIESLKAELGQLWENELDGILSHLTEIHQELEAQMSALSALREMQEEK
jgi:GTP-binding protein EngB required for normal cell division